MRGSRTARSSLAAGLSARLLLLTVLFVMLSEILIFVPSIARFRTGDLVNRLAKAHLAVLALEATPDAMVGPDLETALLRHAGAYAIVLSEPNRRLLMLGEYAPPRVDAVFDLREETASSMIKHAFSTLAQRGNRVLRVIGVSPAHPAGTIAILIDEAPLRSEMRAYSIRILTLSIIISLLTAGLVFFSLQWLMVRPIVQLTEAMTRFREDPEDDGATLQPTRRRDEIGIAQRELAVMQSQIRTALREKSRLAALGAAMARINHDLRNALATAALASDRLSGIADPEVQRVTPKLYQAIDRAIALCTQTLDFVRDVKPTLRLVPFRLAEPLDEVEADLAAASDKRVSLRHRGGDVLVAGDPVHFVRVLANLVRNAAEAGAKTIDVDARIESTSVVIEVVDDGPGIPEAMRAHLFTPFSESGRPGGTGLGLAIAREIVRAHGGDLTLARTGPSGTTFRIELPAPDLRSAASAA